MTQNTSIKHKIQKHILSVLASREYARFRDMRPEGVDSNHYNYHLKLLVEQGYIDKADDGYTLGAGGLEEIRQLGLHKGAATSQPGVQVLLIIQNGYGGVLMRRNKTQPFIGRWTLPSGEVERHDASIAEAASRALKEQVGECHIELTHAGDAYIRMTRGGEVKGSTLTHVFYATTDEELANDELEWISPHKVPTLATAPAIEEIVARVFFRDPYFFEEFDVAW